MTIRRNASFGTYFFIGFVGMLVGSVIGRTLMRIIHHDGIDRFINLYGFAGRFYVQAGYTFTLNLVAIIGIVLAIYIYRRI